MSKCCSRIDFTPWTRWETIWFVESVAHLGMSCNDNTQILNPFFGIFICRFEDQCLIARENFKARWDISGATWHFHWSYLIDVDRCVAALFKKMLKFECNIKICQTHRSIAFQMCPGKCKVSSFPPFENPPFSLLLFQLTFDHRLLGIAFEKFSLLRIITSEKFYIINVSKIENIDLLTENIPNCSSTDQHCYQVGSNQTHRKIRNVPTQPSSSPDLLPMEMRSLPMWWMFGYLALEYPNNASNSRHCCRNCSKLLQIVIEDPKTTNESKVLHFVFYKRKKEEISIIFKTLCFPLSNATSC